MEVEHSNLISKYMIMRRRLTNLNKNLDKNVPPKFESWVKGFLVSTARTFPGIFPDSPKKTESLVNIVKLVSNN